jgi:hypothetical protein
MPASDYEVESSRLIAELLDDAVVFSDAGYSASAQSAFLTHAIDALFHGRSAYFAAHLGVSKSQMHGWAKGQVRMSLPRLALTAYCCGCAIADILLGNRVMLSLRPAPHCQRRRLIKRGGRGARRSKDDLCAELDALIRSGRARNATEAAQTIELSLKYLRKNFPDQHALLVGHGHEVFASLRSQATPRGSERTTESAGSNGSENRAAWLRTDGGSSDFWTNREKSLTRDFPWLLVLPTDVVCDICSVTPQTG